MNGNTRMVIANSNSGNWFGAFGSWTAYSGGTPGYPNTAVTSGYMDLYIRIGQGESTVYDSSGNDNNGSQRSGTQTFTTDTPIFRSAASFNGSSDNITGSFPSYETDVTFMLWVKFNALSGGYHLLDCRNSSGAGYQPMYIEAGRVQMGNSGTNFVDVNYSFSTGVWYHIAIVHSASDTKTYINGVLINTSTAAKGYNFNQALPFYIGSRYSAQNWLNGFVSDFRIYETALSADDILSIYNKSA